MRAHEVTVEWLRKINFEIQPSAVQTIEGVVTRELKVNLDGRGDVTELWSEPWIEDGLSPARHCYQSATDFRVIKCWHLHASHTDQFTVTRGKLQVTVADVRPDSDSFGHVNSFFIGSLNPSLIKIPPMILHGWKALTMPEVLVVNFQSEIYDPGDEFKFPWDCVLQETWQPRNG
ncbi:MAG: dTDP-4-dehydrorhamnose 3,5-epimerase family protein [Chloracidobacterium sp.]|nr:dTDP-4-dehydrorhamnose 3,5-epimerase family protein [Chloracidobacterium sp.]